MEDRERSDAPTAVERPRGSAPSEPSEPGPTRPDAGEPGKIPSTSASAFDPPHDRFEPRAELGRGGMGRVEEAYDRALGRAVAIKHMLHPNVTELARFEREARITARLEHPGIVPIHDAGRADDGTPYYVMRRVDGRPLSEVVERKTLAERLAVVPNLLAACDAAAFAHARGVVHRDIKPTNILIGPFGETLLIDWGLAREVATAEAPEAVLLPSEPDLTRAGTVAGTPGFMSPEQARGEAVDARADVFALGVTLFFMLAGKLPWPSTSATEMVNVVGAGRAPAWNLLPRDVPVDLRAVLEKAMASDPAQRYADAGALAADLRRFITGQLVGAHQYGRIARIARFLRRHRAAAAVALVSLVVVSVVAVISIRRVVAERDDANAARALAELRQRESVDVADALLVETAHQLAERNPSAAIAKLRKLSPTSKRWREAWAAASTAWFNGIPFGFVGDAGSTVAEVASDSRSALVANRTTGQLLVLDLAARTRRVLKKSLARFYGCFWFDNASSILCNHPESLELVDVATGTSRSYPVTVRNVHSNRGSKILVFTEDQRVLELKAPSREFVEIFTGIKSMSASPDLAWLVLQTEGRIELRNGDHVWPIPTAVDALAITVRDGVVAVLEDALIRVFVVEQDKLVETRRVARPLTVMKLEIVDGAVFALTANGIEVVTKEGLYTTDRFDTRVPFETLDGYVLAGSQGQIVVRDTHGSFEIGARPLSYRWIDQSPDRRYVLACVEGGDILVWDLQGPRGSSLLIDKAESVGQMTGDTLWTSELMTGVHRHDLRTGTDEVFANDWGPMTLFDFDQSARWIVISEPDSKTHIYDLALRKIWEPPAASTDISFDEDGLGFAVDRAVLTWFPGTNQKPRKVIDLPLAPEFIGLAQRFVIAVARDREVMRAHLDTQTIDRTVSAKKVKMTVIEVTGRGWFVDDEGTLWRWDLDREPFVVPTPEPLKAMVASPHGLLLLTSKSVAIQDGDKRRLLSADSSFVRVMGEDLLALRTSTQMINVVDLETGKSIELPGRTVNEDTTVVAQGLRIGAVTSSTSRGQRFTYWDLTVPREPAALQKWLATITNAVPIPDSDAVVWPAN